MIKVTKVEGDATAGHAAQRRMSREKSAAWLSEGAERRVYKCVDGSTLTICVQPAAFITDYLLAALCAALACALLILEPTPARSFDEATDNTRVASWHIAFLLSSAASALLGGFIHHYCHKRVSSVTAETEDVGERDSFIVAFWSIVLACGSAPNFCLFGAGVWLLCEGDVAVGFTAGGGAAYLLIALAVGYTRKVLIHVCCSVPSILFYIGASARRIKNTTAVIYSVGAGVTLLLAGVCILFKPTVSRQFFNHNALMHCILMVTAVLLFMSSYYELE
eukprot:Rhum_TRINITY_DN6439_c0_g1::Rhum_TRINITY_DN6439_c0_g1_i1::g.19915::m.19915